MSKNEECTCKACKTIVFHRQVCKFETFLLPSSSWLLKLPNEAEWGPLALRHSKTSLPDLVTLSALPPFHTQALNGVLEVSFVHRQCNFLIVNKQEKLDYRVQSKLRQELISRSLNIPH